MLRNTSFRDITALRRCFQINSFRKLKTSRIKSAPVSAWSMCTRAQWNMVRTCQYSTMDSGISALNTDILTFSKQVNEAVLDNDVTRVLELFKLAKAKNISPSFDEYSRALHLLFTRDLHEELDRLYKDMQNHGYPIGQGVKTTLVRSYVSREMWNEAIDLLNEMEESQLMRHTRSYNPVIKGLAQQGYHAQAFELFEKKIKKLNLIANKRENVLRDTEMFVTMIKSCTKVLPSQERLSDKGQNILINKANVGESNKCDNGLKGYSLVEKLFEFFHHVGMKFPSDILEACEEWFACDPNNVWTWNLCGISKQGQCSVCGKQLENNIPQGYFKDLEKEIIQVMSTSDSVLDLSQNEFEELKAVRDICEQNGPFDVIIDAQNIGLEGRRVKVGNISTKNYGQRIKNIVEHFSKQGKNIFFPLHHRALQNDISEELLDDFRNKSEVVIMKTNVSDDLLMLYAAALSGLDNNKTVIVTNDNWRDHSVALSQGNHWKLLKWVRLNHMSFKIIQNKHIQFYKNLFDPVVQRSATAWHFPVVDGSWCCARLK